MQIVTYLVDNLHEMSDYFLGKKKRKEKYFKLSSEIFTQHSMCLSTLNKIYLHNGSEQRINNGHFGGID